MISRSSDFIDFVSTPPFLRIALRVSMATMHFHIAQTGLSFRKHFFRIMGTPWNNVAQMKNCHGWVQGRSNWILGYVVILEIRGPNKQGYVTFSTFARPKNMQILVFILLKDSTK